jgi:hypothetical protein
MNTNEHRIDQMARAICCAEVGDTCPTPVPDALMPAVWHMNRDNYLAMARAAAAELAEHLSCDERQSALWEAWGACKAIERSGGIDGAARCVDAVQKLIDTDLRGRAAPMAYQWHFQNGDTHVTTVQHE